MTARHEQQTHTHAPKRTSKCPFLLLLGCLVWLQKHLQHILMERIRTSPAPPSLWSIRNDNKKNNTAKNKSGGTHYSTNARTNTLTLTMPPVHHPHTTHRPLRPHSLYLTRSLSLSHTGVGLGKKCIHARDRAPVVFPYAPFNGLFVNEAQRGSPAVSVHGRERAFRFSVGESIVGSERESDIYALLAFYAVRCSALLL